MGPNSHVLENSIIFSKTVGANSHVFMGAKTCKSGGNKHVPPQIKLHPNSCQYPFINYLAINSKEQTSEQIKERERTEQNVVKLKTLSEKMNLEEIKSHLEFESKSLQSDDKESFERLSDCMEILVDIEEKIKHEKRKRHEKVAKQFIRAREQSPSRKLNIAELEKRHVYEECFSSLLEKNSELRDFTKKRFSELAEILELIEQQLDQNRSRLIIVRYVNMDCRVF